jgi:hypothetical protein
MKYQNKLAEFAQRELPALMDRLIIPDDQGFNVFGRYRIEKRRQGYTVIKSAEHLGTFRQSRTALAWCIADKINHVNLANQILSLETISTRYHNDIEVRSAVANRTSNGAQWETINYKLSHKRQQLSAVNNELEKCISQAKYYQIRGFSNETN